MGKQRLNGSVVLLAQAMRQVFTEAVDGAVRPLTDEVKALRTEVHDMEDRLNTRIDTTNDNVQAQFAEQEKKIGKMLARD